MTAGELNSVRNLATQIRTLEKTLHGLRMLATNLTPLLDGMPHDTTVKSRVEEVALKIIAAETELDALQKEFTQAKEQLINQILGEIDEPVLQTLLILRFVNLMTWTQITRQMNYERSWVFRFSDLLYDLS